MGLSVVAGLDTVQGPLPGSAVSAAAAIVRPAAEAAPAPGRSAAASSVDPVYYTNPVLKLDSATGVLVREWRDARTGDKQYQIPNRAALLYRHVQGLGDAASPALHPLARAAAGSEATETVRLSA